MIKKRRLFVSIPLMWLCAGIMLLPVVLIFSQATMRIRDVNALFESSTPNIAIIPPVVSMEQFYGVLIEHQKYLEMFFNSLWLTLVIAVFHTLVSFLSGYVLAKVPFYGRRTVYFLYVLFMVMPLQVTLLPVYMMSKVMGIYNSWWSLILPGVFAPLGVFMMRQFILSVPDELCASVRLESKSTCILLFYVIAPYVKAGLITLFVIAVSENWNMVEQPLLLLSDPGKYPLSIVLNSKDSVPLSIQFAGAVVFMLPMGLLYLMLKEQILNGLGGITK
jgi:multiple sugar transport system permease protein